MSGSIHAQLWASVMATRAGRHDGFDLSGALSMHACMLPHSRLALSWVVHQVDGVHEVLEDATLPIGEVFA